MFLTGWLYRWRASSLPRPWVLPRWIQLAARQQVPRKRLLTNMCGAESAQPPDEVVVTHPFHPLHGKSFPYHDRGTLDVRWVRCVNDDRTLLSLVTAHTNYREVDAFERASAGRSPWRLDDFLRVRDMVDSLLERLPRHDQ